MNIQKVLNKFGNKIQYFGMKHYVPNDNGEIFLLMNPLQAFISTLVTVQVNTVIVLLSSSDLV